MNNAYRSLMEQQHLSDQAKQTVYNNLHNTESHKSRLTFLKVAVIVACIVLIIPASVLAAEYIFSIARFRSVENATIYDQPGVGYEIRFNTVQNHPIAEFAEHLQKLKETTLVCYDSWEDAEEDLGIDLISNSICTDGETKQIIPFIAEGTPQTSHCEGVYYVEDGQLYSSHISAVYMRSRVKFRISARLTAEHPVITDEASQQYHGFKYIYFQEDAPSFTTEQYITKNGLPMTISIVNAVGSSKDRAGFTDFNVYFAVNDISYEVSVVGCEGVWNDAHIYSVLCEILEGFVL